MFLRNTMISNKRALRTLVGGIFASARNGQTLPLLTVLLILHSIVHVLVVVWVSVRSSSWTVNFPLYRMSYTIFLGNFYLNIVGYIFLIRLYKHSVSNIFNRKLPATVSECIPSFCAHLSLLRPLEILYRFLTYRWRVLPDVIVLGEVRCGTTSLCQHLAMLRKHDIDCHTPFCLWAHPELDHKETFFFVGHYLGFVTPEAYRMCFPLKITKWWRDMKWQVINLCRGDRSLVHPPFMTFDGCAQYLTSPTAPALIAEAYRAANQAPPVLIACVRNPSDQTLSWWRYENNAMVWGDSMGLTAYDKELRGAGYPPKSIDNALKLSSSKETSDLYDRAECLFSPYSLMRATAENKHAVLPPWAMTWPGGQLSGIGRNADYVKNIMRYEESFRNVFSKSNNAAQQTNKTVKYVNIMPIEYLRDRNLLKSFLYDILMQVSTRGSKEEKLRFESALQRYILERDAIGFFHRNAIPKQWTSCSSRENLSKESIDIFEAKKESIRALCEQNGVTWSC
jgi:hypothetical protein